MVSDSDLSSKMGKIGSIRTLHKTYMLQNQNTKGIHLVYIRQKLHAYISII